MHQKTANEGTHWAVLGFFPAATLRDLFGFSAALPFTCFMQCA
jgi:hypothetical protein